jgi:predicted transcriptional regulator
VLRRVTLYYMLQQTLTVRIDTETRAGLDAIAATLDRDRSYVVKEALSAYLETHRWQVDHIRKGLRQAQAGKFVKPAEAQRTIARLRRK